MSHCLPHHRALLSVLAPLVLGCHATGDARADSGALRATSAAPIASVSVSRAHESIAQPTPVRDSVARALLLGDFRLPLDSSVTLANIQTRFGVTSIVEGHGHDDDNLTNSCYVGTDADGPFTLHLHTNEIGGGERILGFEVRRLEAQPAPTNCAPLKQSGAPRSDNGLRLGMSIEDALGIEGAPSSKRGRTYVFDRAIDMTDSTKTPPEAYSDVSIITIDTSNGRVVRFRVWYARMV